MKTINELTFNKVVYYIKTKKVEDPKIEKQIGDELLVLFKSLMTQKEAYHYVVFSEEDTEEEYLFLFISKNKILQVIEFIKSKGALKSFKEISTDILMDRIISDDFNSTFLKKDEFNHILDKFIYENLTVDVVLDKINESGINSLKKIDYDVLASKKESNSKSKEFYYSRGRIKNDLGDYKGALEDYSKSIELNAECTEAYIHRGILYLELKEIKGACLDFKKAKELGWDDVTFLLEEHCK